MKKQEGSVILVIILLCIISLTIYLILYKIKHPRQQQQGNKSDQIFDTQNNNTSSNNTPIILEDGEIINPFDLNSNNPQVIRGPSTPINTQSSNIDLEGKTKQTPQQEIILPNGKPIPIQSGLIGDIPRKYNNGGINISIDNRASTSNIIVYLYHMRPLNTPESSNFEELAAGALVDSGGVINFTDMDSGFYRIKWYVLSNKKAYQNDTFAIYKDNKYSYDRVFRFKETPDSNKVREMQIKTDFLK